MRSRISSLSASPSVRSAAMVLRRRRHHIPDAMAIRIAVDPVQHARGAVAIDRGVGRDPSGAILPVEHVGQRAAGLHRLRVGADAVVAQLRQQRQEDASGRGGIAERGMSPADRRHRASPRVLRANCRRGEDRSAEPDAACRARAASPMAHQRAGIPAAGSRGRSRLCDRRQRNVRHSRRTGATSIRRSGPAQPWRHRCRGSRSRKPGSAHAD